MSFFILEYATGEYPVIFLKLLMKADFDLYLTILFHCVAILSTLSEALVPKN